MGDVCMTVPVIHCLAEQHRELRITVLTQQRFADFFSWMPANVEVIGVDLKKYDGVMGIGKLYQMLRKKHFDAVADLHDVIRSKYLISMFRLSGTKVAVIDKGRKDKKALIGHGQDAKPLRRTTQRYAEVFDKLGFDIKPSFVRPFEPRHENFNHVNSIFGIKPEGETWIGIAPFAAHKGKVYPESLMCEVVKQLSGRGYKIFLFGAGQKEKDILTSWETDGVLSVCGKLNGLKEEMLLMTRLNLMIAMDSANMHMAAILGIPTLSIWGATHPKAGFTGWGQTDKNIMQLTMPCRPCSVYGEKPCKYGDFRCLIKIKPENIVKRAEELIGQ